MDRQETVQLSKTIIGNNNTKTNYAWILYSSHKLDWISSSSSNNKHPLQHPNFNNASSRCPSPQPWPRAHSQSSPAQEAAEEPQW